MPPLRNALSAFSRATWPRSPCTAPTAKPRSASSSATFCAVRLVRVKIIVSAAAAACRIRADQLGLVQRVRAVDVLLGGVVDRGGVRRLSPDVRRLGQERAGQRDDRTRHGRREEHRLPLVGDLPQDALDVGQEAQVEHLVGLVEDQHRQLPSSRWPCWARSSNRPGVPTTTSAPARSASICGS